MNVEAIQRGLRSYEPPVKSEARPFESEDTDPRVLEVLEADEKLRAEVEEAWRLMCTHFPEAEIELEYSVEMDEGADPNDFQVAIVAYTLRSDRLHRLRQACSTRRASARRSSRVVINARFKE